MRWSSLATGLTAAMIIAGGGGGGNVALANPLFTHHTGMQIGDTPARYSSSSSSLSRREADRLVKEGLNGWGTFDQLIDHGNPDLGTFKQRFWYGTEFWKGPGSPVIVVNPGEDSAEGFNETYTTNSTLSGRYAQENGGAVVIVEHRYWGESSPFDTLTVENLAYLTLENSLQDMVYFAKNFVPPFDPSGDSSSENAPYIYLGGSYPGAIAGWLATLFPGEGFWAYHGTSGVVQTVGDFYDYYAPASTYMPRNCSKDVTAVIDYVDGILLNGTAEAKYGLKKKFGLETLVDEDFASALAIGPAALQDNQFTTYNALGYNTLNLFCDYVENVPPGSDSDRLPGANGVGLKKALDGYAQYMKLQLEGSCDGVYDIWDGTLECWNSQDASSPMYTDLSVNNYVNRQWMWLLCNEPFEWWQTTSPRTGRNGTSSSNGIISRLVTYETSRSQCSKHFPPPATSPNPGNNTIINNGTNSTGSSKLVGILQGKTFADVNKYTQGGWLNTDTKNCTEDFSSSCRRTRLMHSNGDLDPWRDATMASQSRPGGPLKSTPELPHFVIEGGTHCSDLYSGNWEVNEGMAGVVEAECEIMRRWIGEFYDMRGGKGEGKAGRYQTTTGSTGERNAGRGVGKKRGRTYIT